mgnify:CR=1 FL=1
MPPIVTTARHERKRRAVDKLPLKARTKADYLSMLEPPHVDFLAAALERLG